MSALEISPLPGVAGLRLDGELDLATAPLLKEALVDLGYKRDVHLDLALLTFLDSSGRARHSDPGTSLSTAIVR